MTTYSIDLDDVDLALLPLRTHRYNDFLKKEHFQFQVMKTDVVEQPEPAILYTCHICAIDVPAAFAREHTSSIKHRANARIASVAVKRTRALITALPPPAAAQPTARFCANCATTVGKNHEKTKEHRVCVMHDKMLWELMTAYVGDDDVSNYDSEDSDTDLSIKEKGSKDCNGFGTWDVSDKEETQNKCDKTLKTIDTTNKDINKNEAKEKNQYKDNNNIDNNTKISETGKIESVSNGGITDSTSKDRETELRIGTDSVTNKEDMATSTEPKAAEIKIDYVEFVTKDNKHVKVFSDYYHSFTRKVDTINCIVCSSTFKNNEVNSHMFSLKHLNKMPTTLIDEHCVRQFNDTYSHCILCNQMVKISNVTKHHLTIGHGQREKQAVTDQSTTSKIDKTSNIDVASSANINVASPAIESVTPKTGKQAVTATQSTTSKIDKTSNIDVASSANINVASPAIESVAPKTGKQAVTATQSPTSKIDKTSNIDVASTANINVASPAIESVAPKTGKQAVTATRSTTSKIDKTSNIDVARSANQVTAKGTAKFASSNGDVKAPEKAKNEAKVGIYWPVIYPYEITKQESTVRCVICDCQVPNNPENRKSHLGGLNHAKNVKNKRLIYEGTEDINIARCVICDVKVPMSPGNLKLHLKGRSHADNAKTKRDAQRKLKGKAVSLSAKATQRSNQEPKTIQSISDSIRRSKYDELLLIMGIRSEHGRICKSGGKGATKERRERDLPRIRP